MVMIIIFFFPSQIKQMVIKTSGTFWPAVLFQLFLLCARENFRQKSQALIHNVVLVCVWLFMMEALPFSLSRNELHDVVLFQSFCYLFFLNPMFIFHLNPTFPTGML